MKVTGDSSRRDIDVWRGGWQQTGGPPPVGDLGIAPIIVAAIIGAAGGAIGGYFTWRSSRDNRHAAETTATAMRTQARSMEEVARMEAQVATARIRERQDARAFVEEVRRSGATDQQVAMALATATGESPTAILKEVNEAKKTAQTVPGWAYAVGAFFALRLLT